MKRNFKLCSLLVSLELFGKHALPYQHSGGNTFFVEEGVDYVMYKMLRLG